MQIDIQSRGFQLTDALHEHIVRRLRFSLTHATDQVQRVTVRLSDVNGPRGGVDKRCAIHVVLNGRAEVVNEDTEADLYIAVNRATDRVGRTVLRRLTQQREHPTGLRLRDDTIDAGLADA
jgi:putative sigma-54 modulation protein